MAKNIDELLNRFRLASREIFNSYFKAAASGGNDIWNWEARFSKVEASLFNELVLDPCGLPVTVYGTSQPQILVQLRANVPIPVMVNRDISSGYWDFPINELPFGVRLHFLAFFDWDQTGTRDNQYVRAEIEQWPSRDELAGKHVLIEARYVKFVLRNTKE